VFVTYNVNYLSQLFVNVQVTAVVWTLEGYRPFRHTTTSAHAQKPNK